MLPIYTKNLLQIILPKKFSFFKFAENINNNPKTKGITNSAFPSKLIISKIEIIIKKKVIIE